MMSRPDRVLARVGGAIRWLLTTTAGLVVSLGVLAIGTIIALAIALSASSQATKAARTAADVALEQSRESKALAAEANARAAQAASQQNLIHLACVIVNIGAEPDPPPTTDRGVSALAGYQQLARALHCTPGKAKP